MSKAKEQFLQQVHDRCFSAWWEKEECKFPLVHTKDAKTIFIAGRIEMEKGFIKQKSLVAKAERQRRSLQSKIDKGLK